MNGWREKLKLAQLWRNLQGISRRRGSPHYAFVITDHDLLGLEAEMERRLGLGEQGQVVHLIAPMGTTHDPPWVTDPGPWKLCTWLDSFRFHGASKAAGIGYPPMPPDSRDPDCAYCGTSGVYYWPYRHYDTALRHTVGVGLTILTTPPPEPLRYYSFDQLRHGPIMVVLSKVSDSTREVLEAGLEGRILDVARSELALAELIAHAGFVYSIRIGTERAKMVDTSVERDVELVSLSKGIPPMKAICEAAWLPRLLSRQGVYRSPFAKTKHERKSGVAFTPAGHVAVLGEATMAAWWPNLTPFGYERSTMEEILSYVPPSRLHRATNGPAGRRAIVPP